MRRLRGVMAAGLVVLLGARAIAGEPYEARELVAKLKASLEAIRSVQGTYRAYDSPKTAGATSIAPDGHPAPGAIAGPGDLILHSEYDWAWLAHPYREAIDGKWSHLDENRMVYTRDAFFHDGATLRALNRDAGGGLIKPLDETFWGKRNPLHLIGIGFDHDSQRNLDALLSGARLVPIPGAPARLKVLKSDYRDQGQDLELTVWIDTESGHLPRRIETFEKARRFVDYRVENDEIREVSPGVWMALRGSETAFYAAEIVPPPGMTKERVEALDYEGRVAMLAKSKVIPGMLGNGPRTWIVDTRGLRVNQEIPRSRFVLNYPEGTRLLDTTHEPPLRYQFKADRTPEEWREIVAEAAARAGEEGRRGDARRALVGKPAPEFPADSVWINGPPLKVADLAGKVVLLDFWAEWCGPCRNDLPGLAALHRRREETGVTIIGVHPVGSDRAAIDKVINEFHLDYPIIVDVPPPDGARGWGTLHGRCAVTAIPHAVLIDRRGEVVASGFPAEVLDKARKLVAGGGAGTP